MPSAAAFAASAAADSEEMQFDDAVADAPVLSAAALEAAAVALAAAFVEVPLVEESLDEPLLLPVVAETSSTWAVLLVAEAVASVTTLAEVVDWASAPVIHVQMPLSQPHTPSSELDEDEDALALALAEAEALAVDAAVVLVVVAGDVVFAVCALAEAAALDALGVGVLLVAEALGDALEELADALAEVDGDCVDEHTVGKGSAVLLEFAASAGLAANATPTSATTALGTPMAVNRRERSTWARR